MSYFKNVTSLSNLKSQFRSLALKNHPDAGGDPEIMKEINIEYDALFAIWKTKQEKETGNPVSETAETTRRQFYSESGWEGSNYNASLTTKDICKIIRAYVKEKYPTYKFSVRFHTASMCSEIFVSMTESPLPIWKTFDELTGRTPETWSSDSDIDEIRRRAHNWGDLSWDDMGDDAKLRKIYESNHNYWIRTEIAESIVKDVDAFVDSYRYEDIDGMTDYFDVSDYYFGCQTIDVKVVPKTARIQNTKNEMAKQNPTDAKEIGTSDFTITKTKHTKTNADIWVVKCTKTLTREDYLSLAAKMKSLGGYYSKFVHGFVFKKDPTEILKAA